MIPKYEPDIPITAKSEKLIAWDSIADAGLAHNGVIRKTTNGDVNFSDTALYIQKYIAGREITDEFVKELYKTNVASGVDYMEFGYKASKNMFKESEFGKWKFCNEEDIRAIVGTNNTDMKIAVINGSPKGKYSITLQSILYLQKLFPKQAFKILHVGQKIKSLEKWAALLPKFSIKLPM